MKRAELGFMRLKHYFLILPKVNFVSFASVSGYEKVRKKTTAPAEVMFCRGGLS